MKQKFWIIGFVWLLLAGEVKSANLVLPWKKNEPNLAQTVPFNEIPARHQEAVRFVVDKAVLSARGPAETFFARPEHYQYFLDHPDKTVIAWRRLGAKCVTITPRGPQQFGWSDENGSAVQWETIVRTATTRIWYAEGQVRPGQNLPLVPVKALVIIRHNQGTSKEGGTLITHQSDVFLHTDSKTVTMLTRMLGPSARNLAEQGLGQLQLFFAGVSYHLERHPDQISTLIPEDR